MVPESLPKKGGVAGRPPGESRLCTLGAPAASQLLWVLSSCVDEEAA